MPGNYDDLIKVAKARAVQFNGFINPAPLQVDWGAIPQPEQNVEPVVEFKDLVMEGTALRGEATPNFNILYDTADEVQLRLRGTFIAYKSQPVFVEAVLPVNAKKTDISVIDAAGNRLIVDLKDPEISCRSLAPGFIDLGKVGPANSTCGYLMRTPARVFQQGMNNQNSSVINISDGVIYSISDFNRHTFMRMFELRRMFTPFTKDLFAEVSRNSKVKNGQRCARMLSTNFAVSAESDTGNVYYRTTKIASIQKGVISGMKARVIAVLGPELKQLNLI